MGVAISIGCSGLAIIIYTFYGNLDKQVPIYINPFSIPVICSIIPLGIFVGLFFAKQTKLVSKGITAKQQVSIIQSGTSYNTDKTKTESFFNIIKFLLKTQKDSLILSN
jgi:hypothetical protein